MNVSKHMVHRSRRFLMICLIAAAALALSLSVHAQGPEKTVRVGWYESPFNTTDQFGRRSGYAYDYQQNIAAYTGWSYEYVEGSWPELMQMLIDGEIDLISDVSYTEERAERMLFSALPMGAEEFYIFISPDNIEIDKDNLPTFNGKKAGAYKGSVQADFFREWAETNGVQAELIEMTEDVNETLAMLNRGDIDLYVVLDGYLDAKLAVPVCKVGASDFYFAVNKSRPELLSELNAAMSRIQEEDYNYNQHLYDKYLSTRGSNLFLTPQELNWLSQNKPIRVGYRDNYLAFCAQDPSSGELTGALAEFLTLASDCLMNAEIRFETTAFPTTTDALAALENGEIDCVFPVNLSYSDAEESGILVTTPQMETEMYAVVRTSAQRDFSLQGDVTVAVNEGNPNYEAFLMDNFPNWTRAYFADTDECLKAVSQGKADCILVSNYRINRIAELLEEYKLSTVTTGTTMYASFAVKREQNHLYSILNKMTDNVPEAAMNAALTSFSYVEQTVTFADFVHNHIISVTSIALAVFLVFLLLLVRSRRSEKKARLSEAETRQAMGKIALLNKELADNKASLQEALVASQQASLAKTTFLSNMSHEIRTPLNSIIGFTSLAEQHIDNREKVLNYIQKISTSGKHLLSLINDVLDVSRIESGRLVLREDEFGFSDFLTQINTIIGGQCSNKGLEYFPQAIGTLRRSYIGDEMKLKEVLINILGNAVKYTPAGGTVRFSVEQTAVYNGLCTLRFIVSDTGIGMSEDFLPKLFDAFSQESDNSPNQYGSTGLGMAITKSIVQMMNGEIAVESKKGVGSTFTINVTLKDADKGNMVSEAEPESGGVNKSSAAMPSVSLAGLRVLIAEDIEMNAELLGDILDMEAIKYDWAENGKMALDKFSESPEGYYDAILMDIRMPIMDGLQATRAIRALERSDAATIPIFALSANAFSEDIQKSMQAGMNAHLSKPVDTDQLYGALRKISSQGAC